MHVTLEDMDENLKENIIHYISLLTKDDTWGSYNVAVYIGMHLPEF